MTTLKDEAKAYVPPQMKNITTLEKIPINIDVYEKEFKKDTPDAYTAKCFKIEDVEYRLPNPVLESVKLLIENKPDLEFFKVASTGTGQSTRYTVIEV